MILNLQESALLIGFALFVGMLHMYVTEPKLPHISEITFSASHNIMDVIKKKTKHCYLSRCLLVVYVCCFWFGCFFFMLNHFYESKQILFAYFDL